MRSRVRPDKEGNEQEGGEGGRRIRAGLDGKGDEIRGDYGET
jgi:hypothetical protein